MFSHIYIGTNRFEAAFGFYSALLPELGLELKFREGDVPWAGWMIPGVPRPLFLLGAPYDGKPASAGNGQMTAFQAGSRELVSRCYAIALELGGTCGGPPGLRPHYHEHYYGAYFRDLDGNKLGIACHEPEEN